MGGQDWRFPPTSLVNFLPIITARKSHRLPRAPPLTALPVFAREASVPPHRSSPSSSFVLRPLRSPPSTTASLSNTSPPAENSVATEDFLARQDLRASSTASVAVDHFRPKPSALTEKDIVTIIKKLTGEPAGKCGQNGLKPFCKINPAPKKGDKFWSKKPKKPAMKHAKPPPKKTKGKGKAAAAEPSEVDESQVGDALSENDDNESQEDSVEVIYVSSDSSPSPPKPARRICGKVPFSHQNACLDPNFLLKKAQHTSNRKTRSHSGDLVSGLPVTNKRKPNENSTPTSGDSVMSTLPPMIRVPRAQAKKRKTSGPTPIETLAQTESALSDLKKNLSGQQDARAKSEEKHQLVMAELEKLKADLKRAQADQDAATKRAEKAEAKLATVQQELSGLKRHISNMTQAVFGPRAANLQDDCVLMLKAIYTLTEQLYTGRVLTVKVVMGAKEPTTSIKKMLGCLSTLPPQIGELTRSAARKGILTALSRCLAYAPEINPEEVATGFPQLKDDGSEFVEEDYQRVVKDSRLAATQLTASLDLSKYQAAYDSKNKKLWPSVTGYWATCKLKSAKARSKMIQRRQQKLKSSSVIRPQVGNIPGAS
ncbi:hypothetical protein ZWY2020_025050 [Hordeum vulgare]|nr:hypothetical protein ZWY2020_025050 [Hordeum vulgare]